VPPSSSTTTPRPRRAADAGEAHRDDGGDHLTGRIVAFDPPHVFSFTWGGELLRFELHHDGDGTRLVFTQVLSHRSVAARNGAGWHACLADLDRHIGEPGPPEDDSGFGSYREFVREMGLEPGVATPDGARTWELGHHVDPTRVGEAVSDADGLEAWGGARRADDQVRWDVRSAHPGSLVRVTVDGAADDPETSAEWHALLVQLDMYLAAGMVVPIDPASCLELYERG
jgi:hypothetical protein